MSTIGWNTYTCSCCGGCFENVNKLIEHTETPEHVICQLEELFKFEKITMRRLQELRATIGMFEGLLNKKLMAQNEPWPHSQVCACDAKGKRFESLNLKKGGHYEQLCEPSKVPCNKEVDRIQKALIIKDLTQSTAGALIQEKEDEYYIQFVGPIRDLWN